MIPACWYLIVYDPLPWRVSRTCDLFLINRKWQRWRDVTPVIRLLYMAKVMGCHFWWFFPAWWSGNIGESHIARNCRWPLGPEDILQLTASKSWAFSHIASRKWILPTMWMNTEVYSSPFEPPTENTAQPTLFLQLMRPAWGEYPAKLCPDFGSMETEKINVCYFKLNLW